MKIRSVPIVLAVLSCLTFAAEDDTQERFKEHLQTKPGLPKVQLIVKITPAQAKDSVNGVRYLCGDEAARFLNFLYNTNSSEAQAMAKKIQKLECHFSAERRHPVLQGNTMMYYVTILNAKGNDIQDWPEEAFERLRTKEKLKGECPFMINPEKCIEEGCPGPGDGRRADHTCKVCMKKHESCRYADSDKCMANGWIEQLHRGRVCVSYVPDKTNQVCQEVCDEWK